MPKIKDAFKFLPKSNLPAKEGKEEGFFPFYTSSPTQKKFIDQSQFDGESVIIGSGGSASIHFQNKPFNISSDCFVLKSIGDYPEKLLYYYLYGNIHILERGFQGAGLQHISKSFIENIDLPIVSQTSQNEIIFTLDKLQSIIDKRRESLNLLGKLLEASYISLSWVQNPEYKNNEFPIEQLLRDNKSIRTGPFGSDLRHSEFDKTGDVAVLGIDNVVNNVFQWEENRYISREKYQKLKKYTVKPGDVIITIMGTVGRSTVIPNNIPLAINTKHLATLSLNTEMVNPYFFSYSIHTDPYLKFQLKSKSRGAIMSGLNLEILRKIKTYLPDIISQNKFETIYKEVHARIETISISLDYLEKLFKSFIQITFNTQRISEKSDLDRYLDDVFLQEDLVSKLKTQDFQDYQEYCKAKKILFELLSSDKSAIQQVYNLKRDKMELQMLFNETN